MKQGPPHIALRLSPTMIIIFLVFIMHQALHRQHCLISDHCPMYVRAYKYIIITIVMVSMSSTRHSPHTLCVSLCRFRQNTLNPEQTPEGNMPAAAAAYNVGGMAAFWTATVLRQQPNLERSPIICDEEWEELYREADAVLKTSSQLFDFSIRHSVITDTLRSTYSDQTEGVSIEKVSYAGQRDPHCSSDIQWTSTDAILGETLMEMLNDSKQSVF